MRVENPCSASKPMWATCEKPEGAPIMLLSIPPFFFFLLLLPPPNEDLAAATDEDDPEALAAYLCRSEIFLKRSAASDSDEKAMPIMQSCAYEGSDQLDCATWIERQTHIRGKRVEEGAVLVVREVLDDAVLPDDAAGALLDRQQRQLYCAYTRTRTNALRGRRP